MPKRVTVDENGCVVFVEDLPGLKHKVEPPKGRPATKSSSKKPKSNEQKPKSNKSTGGKKLASAKRSSQPLPTPQPMGWFRYEPWVACSACGSFHPERLWRKHLKDAHEVTPRSSAGSTRKGCKRKGKGSKAKSSRSISSQSVSRKMSRQKKTITPNEQALVQSYEDTRDGGKGLGHARRDNGKFGSLPLYDDYGEESGPG